MPFYQKKKIEYRSSIAQTCTCVICQSKGNLQTGYKCKLCGGFICKKHIVQCPKCFKQLCEKHFSNHKCR